MAAALPVTKLAGLLIKTLAKPMSKRIKHEANRSPHTIKMLQAIGQATHQVTSRLTIWSAGYKVRSVKPCDAEEAQKKGSEFLGESIVFLVGGGVVVWEYKNSKEKEKKKEEKRLQEMRQTAESLEQRLHAIDDRLIALEKVVKDNTRHNIFHERYVEPEVLRTNNNKKNDVRENTTTGWGWLWPFSGRGQ
mmetsp:Transcript_21158/g.32290  ORF Transcript_21158/g.32290 Transcript_21158/m.32290 type:complete len:191 (+) Transcript_21158:165-737(+)